MKNKIKKFIITNNVLGRSQRNNFESGGFYYYSGQRATFSEALKYIEKPGRALDIGAGFGNETKELLRRGFEVVAADPNVEAIEYLKKLDKKVNRTRIIPDSRIILNVVDQALPEMPEGKFDFIACEMVLHFLKKNDALESIRKMQAQTRPGGINVVTSYLEQPAIHTDPRIKPGYFKFLLMEGELMELYSGWEMLYYEEKARNTMGFRSARLIARQS